MNVGSYDVLLLLFTLNHPHYTAQHYSTEVSIPWGTFYHARESSGALRALGRLSGLGTQKVIITVAH